MEFLDDNAVNPKSDPFGINRRCGKLPFTSPDRTASQRGSERGLVSAPFPCETLAGNPQKERNLQLAVTQFGTTVASSVAEASGQAHVTSV